MSTILRESRIETVHDQIVSEVAQRWAKAFQCRVTIKTGPDHNSWDDAPQESDIVGWDFSPRGNRLLWSAEVETEDSLSDPDTHRKWRCAAVPGIPIYLLIPRGTRALAEKMAASADFRFSSIYEYGFVNGVVQIL
ncbi:hypothetical protein ACO9S2_16375 [Nitrospira sp. NS4]|uniref:hypothetical protein n=1 Tax=Nitrospira sp. NS4 TaxID=3414498 RepID=UPI003C2CB302